MTLESLIFQKYPRKNLINFCPRIQKVVKSDNQRPFLILIVLKSPQWNQELFDIISFYPFNNFLVVRAEIHQIFALVFLKIEDTKVILILIELYAMYKTSILIYSIFIS